MSTQTATQIVVPNATIEMTLNRLQQAARNAVDASHKVIGAGREVINGIETGRYVLAPSAEVYARAQTALAVYQDLLSVARTVVHTLAADVPAEERDRWLQEAATVTAGKNLWFTH